MIVTYFLSAFGVIIGILAIWKRSMLLSFIASAFWIAVISHTRTVPLTDTAIGDSTDSIFVVLLLGLAAAMPFICFRYISSDKKKAAKEFQKEMIEERRTNEFGDVFSSSGSDMDETDTQYYARLRRLQRRGIR